MMKIVVAIDSLKGSLTSIQAGEAIEKGIKKVDLEAEVVIKPLADGGEGTVDALVDGMGGNMEFIKKYTWRIARSKMTWYEKLDIVLFTYSLPLAAFFALYIIINVILLPVLSYKLTYPAWMLIPTVAFLIAPMLNDIIYYGRKINPFKLTWYLLHTILLYGSMLYTSLRASIKSTFGKSIFVVTPKEHDQLSRRAALWANKGEIAFGVGVLAIAYIFNKNVFSTIIIAIPALFSVYLALMANRE